MFFKLTESLLLLLVVAEVETETLELPSVNINGNISIEETLNSRRSLRQFTEEPLELEHISQLLWAAQGITAETGYRTAPSAGALYPLNVYAIIGNVNRVSEGLYQYVPEKHELRLLKSNDLRNSIYREALYQKWVRDCSFLIIITGVYERTTGKYGERGIRYVHMEAGHASQNIYLQSVSLGLGTVAVGAFNDSGIRKVMGLSNNETPLYIMPVGKKK